VIARIDALCALSGLLAAAAARAAFLGVCTHDAAADTHAIRAQVVPDGLSASDWSSICAVHQANRHAAFAVGCGYQARNPGQRWRTNFDGRGFLVTPDDGHWLWGLELKSYGFAGQEQAVQGPARVSVAGQRVAYEWDDVLTEWYINDQRGLEHGFTLHRRPAEDATTATPLRLSIAVRGDLCAEMGDMGDDVSFIGAGGGGAEGAATVSYNGLIVLDADGKVVPTWFEMTGDRLLLTVNESGARYPLTIDPIAQQAYLKASNTGGGDQFGYSVAVSGDTVVVGAIGEDSNTTGINGDQDNNDASSSGAAYVFVRPPGGSTWTQQAYLKASNTGASDLFGYSVALSGDTMVVGAFMEDSSATGVDGDQGNNGLMGSGAAYIFVRPPGGTTWSQQAYLKASNTGEGDWFGWSVAISGDTVVVGALREDSGATGVNGDQGDGTLDSGAAYVFVRPPGGTTWSQQAYLKASTTEVHDEFGYSVAVSGDTVVVGAADEDSNATGVNGDQSNNNAQSSGAAFVFVRPPGGTTWSQQAYLKASNTGTNDFFGVSAALSGDTAVIGAFEEDSSATGVNGDQNNNAAVNAGAAYVFTRTDTTWSQQAYLKASNTGAGDQFGWAVAISGDSVVVGAFAEDSSATGVDGDQANNDAQSSGAAYVFTRPPGGATWSQQDYLKASNTGASDNFGESVAVSGDTMVVGARHEDSSTTGVDGDETDNSATSSGAAYVFDLGACPPDLDDSGDGLVNAADLAVMLAAWGPCECPADLDSSGDVGPEDLAELLANWGKCP
jgi:hypothetical protein